MTKVEHVYIEDYLQDLEVEDVFLVETPLVKDLKIRNIKREGVSLNLTTTKTEYILFDDNLQVLKVEENV